MVRVTSRRGAVDVKAWVTRRSPPGVCWMAFHFARAHANMLTLEAGDPVTQTPELKHCAIRVERIGSSLVANRLVSPSASEGVPA
jgi:predicted molibdopterin-dependent oxidoreductase YjgC